MFKTCVVLSFLCVAIGDAAMLPQYFTQCKKSDAKLNDCILDNIKKGFDDFKKGDNSYHIQSISPLKVPKIFLNVNGGLTINLTDVIIFGIDESVFTEAKIDLDKKIINLIFDIPTRLKVISQYDINGKILVLPIQGKGPLNVTFIQPHLLYSINYDLEKRGGDEYIVPKSNSVVYSAKRIYFELLNLFNGNENLGDAMLKFLNENWKEVNGEIGQKIGDAIGEVVMHVIGNFLRKIPYANLFGN